jgi:hypothetical protein
MTLWSPPPGTPVSAPRCAAVYRAVASRTVLARKGSLRRADKPARPCCLLAVLQMDIARRAAPPGSRNTTVSSSCKRR